MAAKPSACCTTVNVFPLSVEIDKPPTGSEPSEATYKTPLLKETPSAPTFAKPSVFVLLIKVFPPSEEIDKPPSVATYTSDPFATISLKLAVPIPSVSVFSINVAPASLEIHNLLEASA